MKRFIVATLLVVLVGAIYPAHASSRKRERARKEVLERSRGYYKDIFMDSGIGVTSRRFLPAARNLGASIEYFASAPTAKLTQKDTLRQLEIFCGSKNDTNGWLLYPDGAPRYRMVYVNGGSAAKHAIAMTDVGAERMRQYVDGGGSYIGTCAGAYIAASGYMNKHGEVSRTDIYWKLWPGIARTTRLRKQSTDMVLERKSPLLRYYDFGGDGRIGKVRHNGGCYAYDEGAKGLPDKTEVLTRYGYKDAGEVQIDERISSWAYKKSAESGRVIMCGSHPEGVSEGERLEYMSAMVLYAMDGNPEPKIKGVLERNEVREMNRRTEDNDPAYTRVGDRQYHHFAVDVPRGCKQLTIKLEGYEGEKGFDLTLCAKRGEMAYHDNTLHKVVSRGCKKSLKIERPKAGRWYVSVFCETAVSVGTGKYGTFIRAYSKVLNGVPYKLTAEY